MSKIVLPPLPRPNSAGYYYISDGELRARDLEVARVVLEAAAKVCEAESLYRNSREKCPWPGDTNPAIQGHKAVTAHKLEHAIRALKISHE